MSKTTATSVRKNWSKTLDTVSREKPVMFTRTHDDFLISNTKLVYSLLDTYQFTADKFIESDGSVTLSLREIDVVENAETEGEAITALKQSIIDYAQDFYKEFALWSSTPNRKEHVPYVLKALLCNDVKELEVSILS